MAGIAGAAAHSYGKGARYLNCDMCQVIHLDQSISYFQNVSIAKELVVLG
jgi:hypothetical protein